MEGALLDHGAQAEERSVYQGTNTAFASCPRANNMAPEQNDGSFLLTFRKIVKASEAV